MECMGWSILLCPFFKRINNESMSLITYPPMLSTFTLVQINASKIKVTYCIRRIRFSPNSQSFWDRLKKDLCWTFSSLLISAFWLFCFSFKLPLGGWARERVIHPLIEALVNPSEKCYVLKKKSSEIMNKHFIFRFLCGLQLSILSRLIIAQKIQSCLKMTGALFENQNHQEFSSYLDVHMYKTTSEK